MLPFIGWMTLWTYGVAPLIIKITQRKSAIIAHHPCDLIHLPKAARNYFLSIIPQLAADGFTTLGSAASDTRNLESYVSRWVNPSTGDIAQIVLVVAHTLLFSVRTKLVMFCTEFEDGTAIATGNSRRDSVWPTDPTVDAIRVRKLDDISQLYWLHRTRVEHRRGDRKPTIKDAVDPVSRLQIEHTYSYQRLIGVGYYSFSADSEKYIPTLKGAFLMTYQMLPPFRQMQRVRLNREALREMQAVGFSDSSRRAVTQPIPLPPLTK